MTKKFIYGALYLCSLVLLPLAASPALAQDKPASATSVEPVFQAFGGKPGLVRLMDRFMVGLLADPRTLPHFKDVNQERVKEKLAEQFCQVLGGGCEYTGEDMKTVHLNLTITTGDFNALVEVLQIAMDAQGIPFGAQNKLLSRLAAMNRAIITQPQ